MDQTTPYEQPDVIESFDDREIFGDTPAATASAVTGSSITPNTV